VIRIYLILLKILLLATKSEGKSSRGKESGAGRLIIDLRILYQYTQGEEEGGEGKAN
jgi:hypothetical protein